ncbi:unnamed protein product [Vitrella brassicaformis CCMP3155]|uniref:Uncharacterized protein n=3 Tax=Vitrella brassicaformis TaxID=1169539 RepID=A0A0G4ET51_VITBC|nr:unnamed protein product [Vitrella brassicaformis CCMP3155]|eukprot:CEM01013.1 unnamed protein product [Vitrella brassicaformis CCMP3155]
MAGRHPEYSDSENGDAPMSSESESESEAKAAKPSATLSSGPPPATAVMHPHANAPMPPRLPLTLPVRRLPSPSPSPSPPPQFHPTWPQQYQMQMRQFRPPSMPLQGMVQYGAPAVPTLPRPPFFTLPPRGQGLLIPPRLVPPMMMRPMSSAAAGGGGQATLTRSGRVSRPKAKAKKKKSSYDMDDFLDDDEDEAEMSDEEEEEEDVSEYEGESDNEYGAPSRGSRRPARSSKRGGGGGGDDDSYEDGESGSDFGGGKKGGKPKRQSAPLRTSSRHAGKERVNYAADGFMDEDLLDDEELVMQQLRASASAGNGDGREGNGSTLGSVYTDPRQIDRVLDHREREGKTEYLIKWVQKSHLHNSWEDLDTLRNCKGNKRVDNYTKRHQEMMQKRRFMTEDEIEQEEISVELNRQIDQDALKAERIIVHNFSPSTGKTYLVKWCSNPYDQCTWETEETMQQHGFQGLINEYFQRLNRVNDRETRWNKSNDMSGMNFEPYTTTPHFLKVNNPDKDLRDYQIIGVNWMIHRFKQRHSGVLLADEMGLGKTIQTISLIGHMLLVEKLPGPYLIITWLPECNSVLYHGNAQARETIRKYELQKQTYGSRRYPFDVLIATPSALLQETDVKFLKSIQWGFMCVDEAHQLKNREAKRFQTLKGFQTRYKLLLSGTPLHNNLEELWSLLHFMNPGRWMYYDAFQRQYYAIERTDEVGTIKQEQLLNLQRELNDVILRRVKKDVEKSLPHKHERILRVELSPDQAEWYRNILARNYEELSKSSGGNKTSLQNICMELKKVCNHPYLLHVPSHHPQEYNQGLVYSSGKICLLDQLLQRLRDKGHRVLIFSQMVRMLNILSDYLTSRGFRHQRLDGTMRKDLRQKAMDHFNAPGSDDFCFLLSTKAGGLGINLTSADTVIIYDSDWNPQNDLQAEARAHRIGQTKTVNIYRLVTKDSIEGKILEKAKMKMVLDTLVVQGLNKRDTSLQEMEYKNSLFGGASSNKLSFSREELAKILRFGAQKLFHQSDQDDHSSSTHHHHHHHHHKAHASASASASRMPGEPLKDRMATVDLDKVLEEAEEGGVTQTGFADELFSSFNNISDFRYQAAPPSADDDDEAENDKRFWEKAIPLAKRQQVDDEKRSKHIVHGKRSRPKTYKNSKAQPTAEDLGLEPDEAEEADAADDSDDEEIFRKGRKGAKSKGKGRGKGLLTGKERVKLFRALCKFGDPELRLDAIMADAKLNKLDPKGVLEEARQLVAQCQKAVEEAGIDAQDEAAEDKTGGGKSATIELDGKPQKADELITNQRHLKALKYALARQNPEVPVDRLHKLPGSDPGNGGEYLRFALPEDIKAECKVPDGWKTIPWTYETDEAVLKGVYIYGMGSWATISNDPLLAVPKHEHRPDRIRKRMQRMMQRLADADGGGKKTSSPSSKKRPPRRRDTRRRRETKAQREERELRERAEEVAAAAAAAEMEQVPSQEEDAPVPVVAREEDMAREEGPARAPEEPSATAAAMEVEVERADESRAESRSRGGGSAASDDGEGSSKKKDRKMKKRKRDEGGEDGESRRSKKKRSTDRPPEDMPASISCDAMSDKDLKEACKAYLRPKKWVLEAIRELSNPGVANNEAHVITKMRTYLPDVGEYVDRIVSAGADAKSRERLQETCWKHVSKFTAKGSSGWQDIIRTYQRLKASLSPPTHSRPPASQPSPAPAPPSQPTTHPKPATEPFQYVPVKDGPRSGDQKGPTLNGDASPRSVDPEAAPRPPPRVSAKPEHPDRKAVVVKQPVLDEADAGAGVGVSVKQERVPEEGELGPTPRLDERQRDRERERSRSRSRSRDCGRHHHRQSHDEEDEELDQRFERRRKTRRSPSPSPHSREPESIDLRISGASIGQQQPQYGS